MEYKSTIKSRPYLYKENLDFIADAIGRKKLR